MTPDDLADALEARIGAKVIAGDLSRPGFAQFTLRAPGRVWWQCIDAAHRLELAPGRLVWRLEIFTGDEDTFTLSVSPRLWIGAPATGAFIAHMAGRQLAAPEARHD
jgi:hypothetical protein